MEEDPSHHREKQSNTTTNSDDEVVDGDPKVWAAFDKSFQQVQSVLDHNRFLIEQVNENERSGVPDNMAKNVSLIQELNWNISKVVSLYSDLNSNFSNACQQHTPRTTLPHLTP